VVLLQIDQHAEDLMTGAPSEVSAKQLRELGIRVVKPSWKRHCQDLARIGSLCRARPILFVLTSCSRTTRIASVGGFVRLAARPPQVPRKLRAIYAI
jgi:hypothetical protein